MIHQEFPRPDLRPYLGKTVTIEIDRPIGYVHRKGEKTLIYPINYGYIILSLSISNAKAAINAHNEL